MIHQRALFLAVAAATLGLGACTPHQTGPTEVGVRFNKVTSSTEMMAPGATYFFMPVLNDWKVYDVSTQTLVMSADSPAGESGAKDDLRFKTRDGNDIETDITIRWRLEPTKAPFLWRRVATTTELVEVRLVRPLARSYVRDVLNLLDSEEFYNPDLRFRAANDATRLLAQNLRPYGVVVEQVLLGNFSFKADYQRLINQRKEAEKQAEKLEAEILATHEANQARLQEQVAELTQRLTIARGAYEQAKRAADAYVSQRRQAAQATLAEKGAVAEALRRERTALNGSAGNAYVTLQLIDALQKKDIRQIPRLPGGNVILDGNRLLEQLGVVQLEQRRATEKSDGGN